MGLLILSFLAMVTSSVVLYKRHGKRAAYLIGVLVLLCYSIVMRGVKKFQTQMDPDHDPNGTVVGFEIMAIQIALVLAEWLAAHKLH